MTKRVLVTGAQGQLGQSIRKVAADFPAFQVDFVGRAELDLTDDRAIQAFFATRSYDYVINAAAYTAVDQAETEVALAAAVNHQAVQQLGEIAKEQGWVLLHVSTDYVFDGTQCRPYLESDAVNPLGVYGRTKHQGEQALLETSPFGAIVRTSWVYSEFGGNFVKTMLRLAEQRDALKVVSDQVGSPTYAGDLAQVLLSMMAHFDSESSPPDMTIYHYSNEGVASWYDLAVATFELQGLPIQVTPIETFEFPTQAARPAYSVLNKRKIKADFKLAIPHWRASLQACLNALQSNR
ncbi:MAG: dTDP-4-dehydrorhamnose reductase [Hydrogenovibrio sp.]